MLVERKGVIPRRVLRREYQIILFKAQLERFAKTLSFHRDTINEVGKRFLSDVIMARYISLRELGQENTANRILVEHLKPAKFQEEIV